MKLLQTHKIAIFGRSGSGKSTLCKTLQRAFPRVVVIDLMNEYGREDTDCIVTGLPGLLAVLTHLTRSKSREFHVVFQFEPGRDDRADCERALQALYEFGDVLIVIEEIAYFMNGEHVPMHLRNTIFRGRHRRIGIMGTAQKPATVSKTFVSQCTHVFVSQMFERNDLKYFADTIGEEASRKLASLKPFQFLHYIPGVSMRVVKNTG